ncbi:glycoside hydrolase [Irpex lacteus]|nr:glycoside hydrolase [Irpex lacteus]
MAYLSALRLSVLTVALAAVPATEAAAQSSVARLPAWNAYACNIDEELILTTGKLMKSLGLQAAGYNYVNLDDCYAEKNRSADGFIVADHVRFKSGMKNLTDQLHEMGFDSGWFTCAGYPGSFQNEERDIKTFHSDWGFDYLKYDNCNIPYDDIVKEGVIGKYQRMADAIKNLAKKTGKPPVVFSLCEWGWTMAQSWRVADFLLPIWTTGDIEANWASIANLINYNSFITYGTDFNGRNDMDIVRQPLAGNGNLTYDESKTHFTAWALMKSPLLIGTNLSAITPEALSILTNHEILAINQDSVEGTSISPFRWGINPDWTYNKTHPAQYWSGKSQNGTVFMLTRRVPWIRAGRQYSVRDLWTHTDNGTAVRNFTATAVPPHGVVALLLKDAGDEPAGISPPCSTLAQCTDKNGTQWG